MGVGLVRSLQPPDILWIHWRVYNSIANTSKGVFFLPPSMSMSEAFSISFILNKTLVHTHKKEILEPKNLLYSLCQKLKVHFCFKLCFVMMIKVIAAAAAKSLQSCPTLCNPIDGSPPGSPIPGIFQARMLEWVAISFSNA